MYGKLKYFSYSPPERLSVIRLGFLGASENTYPVNLDLDSLDHNVFFSLIGFYVLSPLVDLSIAVYVWFILCLMTVFKL